jgi:hypothetical protein
VDIRALLDALKQRKNLLPMPGIEAQSPCSPVAMPTTLSQVPPDLEQPTYTKHSHGIVNLYLLIAKKCTPIPWLPHKVIVIFLRNSRRYFILWVERFQPTDKYKSCSIPTLINAGFML